MTLLSGRLCSLREGQELTYQGLVWEVLGQQADGRQQEGEHPGEQATQWDSRQSDQLMADRLPDCSQQYMT